MSDDDPFAVMQKAAERAEADKLAPRKVAAAQIRQMNSKTPEGAFFTVVGMNLDLTPDWDNCPTAATDGKRLIYNPGYIHSLPPDMVWGEVCGHEPLHVAFGDVAWMHGKNAKVANIAADLQCDEIEVEAKFPLPPIALLPGKAPHPDLKMPDWAADCIKAFPPKMGRDWYYARLMEAMPPKGSKGNENGDGGFGSDDPTGRGVVIPAKDAADAAKAQAQADTILATAIAAAKQRGTIGGTLGEFLVEAEDPTVPWQDVLATFVTNVLFSKDDYSWSRPNKRFIGQHLYLPSLRSETLGEIIIHIDVSGSTAPWLKRFAGELNGVLSCHPCKAVILYGDTRLVRQPQEWEPADGEIEFVGCGGGGTDHRHLWTWIEKRDVEIEPLCVICLTDGETSFGSDPGIPVLWALTSDSNASPPFGVVAKMK